MAEAQIQQEPGELDTAQAEELEASATSPDGEEQESEQEESSDDSAAKPKPRGVQKRIDELTANWRSAERDRDHWRELALQNQKAPAKEEKQESTDIGPPPTLESVEFDETKYQQAMAEWVRKNVQQELTAREQREAQLRHQASVAEQQKVFRQHADKFAEQHPDYFDVAHNPSLPISDAMADVIRVSEQGPQVLYHLGKNPDLAARIYQLPPTQAALEIGRLEVKLSLPQPKKVTNAPPPINSLNGGGETPTQDPDKMTTEQWLQWRRKQLQG